MLYFAVLGCVVEYTAYFTRWQYTTKYSTALCAVHHSVQYTDSPNYHTIKYTNTVLHCTDIKHTLYTVHCTLYKLISLSCEIAPTVFFHRFNQPLPPPPQLQLKIANGQNYHSQCSTVQHLLCWAEFSCVILSCRMYCIILSSRLYTVHHTTFQTTIYKQSTNQVIL